MKKYTYKIEMMERSGIFQSIGDLLAEAEQRLNTMASQGWELDKLMPLEPNGYTSGAIVVYRKQI